MEIESFQLNSEQDVYNIIHSIRSIALSKGFTRLDSEQFILGVSEIANNSIRHAGGGEIDFSILNNGGVLQVKVKDHGPGIPNIDLAKKEGFSTIHTSLGIGLVVAERSTDYFNIETVLGTGTVVTLEKHKPISRETVEYGIVSIADSKYDFNGDQYLIKEYNNDSILIALIDGPGQGYDAYSIANSCKNFVEKNYLLPVDGLLNSLNGLMKESNDETGITVSIARITPGKVTYKGYGDTHAYFVKEGMYHNLTNQSGRLGQIKEYRSEVNEFSFDETLQLILCTDGLSVLPMRPEKKGSAQIIANQLFDDYHKPYGDASILSLKYKLT